MPARLSDLSYPTFHSKAQHPFGHTKARSGFSTTRETIIDTHCRSHRQQQQQTPTTNSKLSSTFLSIIKPRHNGFAFELFWFNGGHLPQTFGMPCGSRMTWFRNTITGRATMTWIIGWTHYELIVLQSIHIITVHTGRKLLMALSDRYRPWSVLCTKETTTRTRFYFVCFVVEKENIIKLCMTASHLEKHSWVHCFWHLNQYHSEKGTIFHIETNGEKKKKQVWGRKKR